MGGEAAVLAYGGDSRIGIRTDVAGSVRVSASQVILFHCRSIHFPSLVLDSSFFDIFVFP
jgi:hypothetical protein